MARRNFNSKWTAEYLVASELSRRGYTVAFTQGSNTANYDLIVGAPNGLTFTVDVKGMAQKGFWLVKQKLEQQNLFYILALVPPIVLGQKDRKRDQIFILTQAEAARLLVEDRNQYPNQKHKMTGFSWDSALFGEDRWEKLPWPTAKVDNA